MTNYPRSPESRYYMKMGGLWIRCGGVVLVLFGLTFFGPDLILGRAPTTLLAIRFAVIFLAIFIAILPLVAIFCRAFPTTVSSAGLKSYNGIGIYSLIPWDALQPPTNWNCLSVKYLRFKKPGMLFASLVPYDLDAPARFTSEMARYLGQENAVVDHLRAYFDLTTVAPHRSV